MNEGTFTICFPTLEKLLADSRLGPKERAVPDVPLIDQNTSVVNTLRQSEFVDASLQATLQEVLDLQGKHVVEFHARLIEHTNTDQTANERIAFEEALGVFLIKGEELTESC